MLAGPVESTAPLPDAKKSQHNVAKRRRDRGTLLRGTWVQSTLLLSDEGKRSVTTLVVLSQGLVEYFEVPLRQAHSFELLLIC